MTEAACSTASNLTWLYLFGMGMMMVFSPIWAIITQLVAFLLIGKVRAWWTERKNKPHVVPSDQAIADS